MNRLPPRVLLVDDDDDHAAIVTIVLSSLDVELELTRAIDGVDALDRLLCRGDHAAAHPPDLVLLDLKLPRIDGIGVLEVAKQHAHARTIPIVMLTTSCSPCDRARAYAHGVNSYLVKPMELGHLRKMLADTMHFWTRWNEPPENRCGFLLAA